MKSHLFLTRSIRYVTNALLIFCILTGCVNTPPIQSFDFGGAEHPGINDKLNKLQINLHPIQVAPNLEGSSMWYRLIYENAQQLRPYAQSRWSVPPSELLKQRFIQHIQQQGGLVSAQFEGVQSAQHLRIDLEEFSQYFSQVNASKVVIRLRATLIRNKQLVAQKTFYAEQSCTTPDALGGASAMPIATDQLITELVTWIQAVVNVPQQR
ncbi:ABC-type transport auxiliary lipoprotein family protein [Undibacterium fentianense]|uniref:Membrane integrity-associated transporter subunit PqiC n=1 Tax=Undibacterium fentianense TaxID=2828728 RepID=A0A941E515_9BURK|nr:ABC-type transport auxiliary lipoprotein family protein [Undibacterium fentianense]MBR7801696.1 membrane integrity-associated transporter subunit PqiC [Undibacterium fentianense]